MLLLVTLSGSACPGPGAATLEEPFRADPELVVPRVETPGVFGSQVQQEIGEEDGRAAVLTTRPTRSPSGPLDEAREWVLDFGRDESAVLEIGILGGSTGVLEIELAENRADLDAHLESDGAANDEADDGVQEVRPPAEDPFPERVSIPIGPHPLAWRDERPRGFRWARLVARDTRGVEARVAIDYVRARLTYRPFQRPGDEFTPAVMKEVDALFDVERSAGPSRLSSFWYAGLHTLEISSSPGRASLLLDGAKRDRAVWAADLAVAARAYYAAGRDPGPIARSIERLATLPRARRPGSQPVASTDFDGGRPEYLDYGSWWTIALRDYWRETADAAFVERLYPKLAEQTEWLRARVGADGLLRKAPEELEWCYTLKRSGAVTYLNVVSGMALEAAAELATAKGRSEDAARWSVAGRRVRDAVLAQLWDEPRGLFVTSSDDRERVSADGNALALASGWLTADRRERVLAALREHLWTPWGTKNVDLPYGELAGPEHNGRVWPFLVYFEADARLQPGRDPADGFELIERTWGSMLRERGFPGTFWEWIGPDGRPESPHVSLAHAWSAGVTALLGERVLGIRPVGPQSYEIAPVPGTLEHADGTRPTPWGPIQVNWKRDPATGRFELDASAPEEVTIQRFVVPAPDDRQRIVVDGREVLDIGARKDDSYPGPAILERGRGFVALHAPLGTQHHLAIEPR